MDLQLASTSGVAWKRSRVALSSCVAWSLLISTMAAGPCPHLESTPATAPTAPELRRQLLRRAQADQEVRQRLVAWLSQHETREAQPNNGIPVKESPEFEVLAAAVRETDEDNRRWMKTVIAKTGWPTATMVDSDGAHAAWLLVQHADADPTFQRQCLDLMLQLPKTESSQSDVAYLTDRVLLAEGKRQLYGTQFATVDGTLQPRPIFDEVHVDERRASVGLCPLAEYAKELKQMYGEKPRQ